MSANFCRIAVATAACALAAPAGAQLIVQKNLSAAMAMTIAQTAIETCKTNGYAVSATVVGRNGEILVQVRGDGTGPHTMENSMRKAYTARTFRRPSLEWAKRTQTDLAGQRMLADVIPLGGGMPIKVGEETIGAVGVSGTSGGQQADEDCAKSAIAKVADQLK